jgi:hypothetical protein
MKYAQDLLPWKVTDISFRPYDGLWSMNPSVHFDGTQWRCVLRCTDYAMPNGVTIRSEKARPAGNQTKNAMVILDPVTWKPIRIFKMQERDGVPRAVCANIGFEDMRIFRTDQGGLQGIAASLHLQREQRPAEGGAQNQPPEQVMLSFDDEYNIVAARPIRGDWWSGSPQKNWVPFDHCAEPRFLYSINRGTMFDQRGVVHGDAAMARPSSSAREVPQSLPIVQGPCHVETSSDAELDQEREREQEQERERERERESRARARAKHPDRRVAIRGGDVTMVRGRKVVADTLSSRPSIRSSTRHGTRGGNETTRVLGTGRTLPPRYEGLRGGTQLVRVGSDAWLGIAHEMRFVKGLKWYWHTWYLVDSKGKMTATSSPMKLAQNGIEFAAGMAIDGDRVVVSFGVDDMECRLGETKLSSVLGILRALES